MNSFKNRSTKNTTFDISTNSQASVAQCSTRDNRLKLKHIPLHENSIFQAAQARKKTQQPWLEPLPPKASVSDTQQDRYFSLNDIYNSKLINERSRITRKNKINEFKLWLEDRRSRGLYGPTIEEFNVNMY